MVLVSEFGSLLDERACFWSESGLVIVYFVSGDVVFCGLEEDLSKDPLSFGAGGGGREGLEGLFCCCGVGRPVGLPVVCVEAWTGFGGEGGEPAVETDKDQEVVRVKSHYGIPPRAVGEVGAGNCDVR